MRRALVVFSGRAEMLWQRLLRPGFRHCSLILDDGDDWLLVEPLASYLQIRKLGNSRQGLANRPRNAGLWLSRPSRCRRRHGQHRWVYGLASKP